MVSSTAGASLGLIGTRQGHRTFFHPVSEQTLPGAPAPWIGHIMAVAAFDVPTYPHPWEGLHGAGA